MTDEQFEEKYAADLSAIELLDDAMNNSAMNGSDLVATGLNNEQRRLKKKINRLCRYYNLPIMYRYMQRLEQYEVSEDEE